MVWFCLHSGASLRWLNAQDMLESHTNLMGCPQENEFSIFIDPNKFIYGFKAFEESGIMYLYLYHQVIRGSDFT